MEKISVVGYARVSTQKDEQDHSFLSQKQWFEEVIENKYKDFELTHVYADKKTATRFQRKDFLQMLQDAGVRISKDKQSKKLSFHADPQKKPEFKYILVNNLSRFARDTLAIDPIRELQNKGVYLIFMDSGKSTENSDDMMFIEMMFTFAANESRDKSIKMKDGLRKTASRGVLFQSRLFGYDYIKGQKKLIIIEEEAETIRKIYDLYINGQGFRQILNNPEIKNRKGETFAINSIKHILSNQKYYGTLIRNKWDSGAVFNKHYPKVKDQSEWKEFEDHNDIPPIISKETFMKVQELWKGKVSSKTQKGIYKGIGHYAGMLKCNMCGANYVRNADRGRIFYQCGTKKSKGTYECDSLNFNLSDLEEAIQYYSDPTAKIKIDNIYKSEYTRHLQEVKSILESKVNNQANAEALDLKSKIDNLINQKKRILTLYLEEKYEKEMLDEKMIEMNKEQDDLQSQYIELSMTNDQIKEEQKEIENAIEQLSDIVSSKNENFVESIENIIVKSADFVGDPCIFLEFRLKSFEKINSIVEKYLNSNLINNSISWYIDKGRKIKGEQNEKTSSLTTLRLNGNIEMIFQ